MNGGTSTGRASHFLEIDKKDFDVSPLISARSREVIVSNISAQPAHALFEWLKCGCMRQYRTIYIYLGERHVLDSDHEQDCDNLLLHSCSVKLEQLGDSASRNIAPWLCATCTAQKAPRQTLNITHAKRIGPRLEDCIHKTLCQNVLYCKPSAAESCPVRASLAVVLPAPNLVLHRCTCAR